MKNFIFYLILIFSILQSDTYSWDNGGTILGSYGNLGSATNVNNTLVLTEDPIGQTPRAHIAAVSGLSGGESIEVCVDMYTPDTDIKGRIWGHYYDGIDKFIIWFKLAFIIKAFLFMGDLHTILSGKTIFYFILLLAIYLFEEGVRIKNIRMIFFFFCYKGFFT